MKWSLGLSLVLGVYCALPAFAASEYVPLVDDAEIQAGNRDPYTFHNPKYRGMHFHSSVPPEKVCYLLNAGPSFGLAQYATLTLLDDLHVFRHGRMTIEAKFRGSYFKFISCSAPNLELAKEFLLNELKKREIGQKLDRNLINTLVDLHPSLAEYLPMEQRFEPTDNMFVKLL